MSGLLARRPLRTVVVGGGPAGLFFAGLLKRRFAHHHVEVLERNPADATFGFGVVFSETTLGGFAAADPQLQQQIAAAGVSWTDIELRRADRRVRCGGNGFSAIARKTLLSLLQQRAREAGVVLRFEHELEPDDLDGADVVFAADGVNSTLRRMHAAALRPTAHEGAARYIWFATPQRFDALTFIFEDDEHGSWAVHAYPFSEELGTFIVETDEQTWLRAGLDEIAPLAPGETDERSRQLCEQLFARHLGGHGLRGNNSRWLTFETLRSAQWSDGRVAFAGDAVHTAHFSVGSGTKMAMEDAVALVDALGAADTVEQAYNDYEAVRRPQVERIQAAAAPSIVWWERFRYLRDRSDEQFAFHFMSRSPSVSRGRLQSRDHRFVRKVDTWASLAIGGRSGSGALDAPLQIGATRLPSRLVVPATVVPDPRVGLGGAALAGAGMVLTDDEVTSDIVAWLHEHTEAAIGRRFCGDLSDADVRRALEAGFDVLAYPLGAEAGERWPEDRVLVVEVAAAASQQEGDATLERLEVLLAQRSATVVAVLPSAPRSADSANRYGEQLLYCDRVKQELQAVCLLAGGARSHDDAATAVLAGRADLVLGRPSFVHPSWDEPAVALASKPIGAT